MRGKIHGDKGLEISANTRGKMKKSHIGLEEILAFVGFEGK